MPATGYSTSKCLVPPVLLANRLLVETELLLGTVREKEWQEGGGDREVFRCRDYGW